MSSKALNVSSKALIVGASGQLGVELVRELRQRGTEVAGYDRVHLDITDAGAVERAVAECEPDAVFNCAAYNQVDVAENDPQTAIEVNGLGVRNLALACRQWDARLVHFSTDYVFDGTAGRPYVETDATHPLSAYAVSKLGGELYAQAYLDNALVVRTSGVFGPAGRHTRRGNFVELMLRLAHEGRPIRVVEDHVASPTFAPLLAARTLDLLARRESGIFHVGGGTPISWFEYAKLIFGVAGLEPELHATSEREYRTPARRPRFSALRNARMEALGIAPMPPLEDALRDYFAARG
jgi:dTDP-4-dehydrorhamnose reductase